MLFLLCFIIFFFFFLLLRCLPLLAPLPPEDKGVKAMVETLLVFLLNRRWEDGIKYPSGGRDKMGEMQRRNVSRRGTVDKFWQSRLTSKRRKETSKRQRKREGEKWSVKLRTLPFNVVEMLPFTCYTFGRREDQAFTQSEDQALDCPLATDTHTYTQNHTHNQQFGFKSCRVFARLIFMHRYTVSLWYANWTHFNVKCFPSAVHARGRDGTREILLAEAAERRINKVWMRAKSKASSVWLWETWRGIYR